MHFTAPHSSIILYGSEIWTLRKGNRKRMALIEMKFFRRTAGYTLFSNKRKEENLGDLKVESVDERLRRHNSY